MGERMTDKPRPIFVPHTAGSLPLTKPRRVIPTIMGSSGAGNVKARYQDLIGQKMDDGSRAPISVPHTDSLPSLKPSRTIPTLMPSSPSDSVKARHLEITQKLIEQRLKYLTPRSPQNPEPEIILS
jgi:hypothetical protein